MIGKSCRMTSPTETEIQNIRLVLAGAKAPEEFGWGPADVAAWGELAAGDPVAFVTLGVWSRRVKEADEETGEERPAEQKLVLTWLWRRVVRPGCRF